MQGTNLGDAPSDLADRSLKTALRIGHVSEESKGVEQIRFPRRIRADQEDALFQRDIHGTKVPPVLKLQVGKSQGRWLALIIPAWLPVRGRGRSQALVDWAWPRNEAV